MEAAPLALRDKIVEEGGQSAAPADIHIHGLGQRERCIRVLDGVHDRIIPTANPGMESDFRASDPAIIQEYLEGAIHEATPCAS
jgi:hypothetical protein